MIIETDPETAAIWRCLTSILDPEFGINIVDLGFIYSVACVEGNVDVVMTLTTPTCPSGAWIHQGVEQAIRALPGIHDVSVDLVFEPPWNTAMMSTEARRQLGWGEEN